MLLLTGVSYVYCRSIAYYYAEYTKVSYYDDIYSWALHLRAGSEAGQDITSTYKQTCMSLTRVQLFYSLAFLLELRSITAIIIFNHFIGDSGMLFPNRKTRPHSMQFPGVFCDAQ